MKTQAKPMPGSPSTKLDAVADAVDNLLDAFRKMKLHDKIDIAARLKAVTKSLDVIDTEVKDTVKQHRSGAEWEVLGRLFKAKGLVVTSERVDVKLLKEKFPEIYQKVLASSVQERVTFEVR